MSTSISDRVKGLFSEKFEIPADTLTPETTLESLGLDSLDKIEFIFALEDEFKISFPERQMTISTVGDVLAAIEKLLAEQKKA